MVNRESFKVLNKARKSGQLWIAYTFEELNMISFQNAYIWQIAQKFPKIETTAIAPGRFIELYNFADARVPTSDSFVDDYDSIQNFVEFKYSNWFRQASLFKRLLWRVLFACEAAPQWIFSRIAPVSYHRLPYKVKAYGRTKHFYLNSGFRGLVKKQLPPNAALLESTANFNTETLGFGRAHRQSQFFNEGFKTLAKIISGGEGYSKEYLEEVLLNAPTKLSSKQRSDYDQLMQFRATHNRAILLRSRNKRIASSNNANAENLKLFADEMASKGFAIINLGAPVRWIQAPNVKNLSHDLPPALVMAVGAKFDYVATSCGGDFFTGWACVPYPLIVFDEEWSLSNLRDSTSLLEARADSGIEDYEICQNGAIRLRLGNRPT